MFHTDSKHRSNHLQFCNTKFHISVFFSSVKKNDILRDEMRKLTEYALWEIEEHLKYSDTSITMTDRD